MSLRVIDPRDNVAVQIGEGGAVPSGHKVARRAIAQGEFPIWTRAPSITTSSSLSPCRPGRGAFGATRGPGGAWASATRFTSCPQWGA